MAKKSQIQELKRMLLNHKVEAMGENQEAVILFESDLDGNGPRELANLLLAKGTKLAAVFAGSEGNYRYVIGSKSVDTRSIAKSLNEKFQGRGGGKPDMVQGSVMGEENGVREEVLACIKRI